MKIFFAKTIGAASVPVFILKEQQSLEWHPFFKLLAENDQKHLLAFQKKSPLKDTHNHLVFLPSGREAALIGVPEKAKWNHRKAMLAARRAVWFARRERVKNIAVNLDDFASAATVKDRGMLAEVMATHFTIANFESTEYKTSSSQRWSFVEEIAFFSLKPSAAIERSVATGIVIGEETNKARALANTPGGDMTPAKLAEEAAKAGKEAGFSVTVLDEAEIKKLKMGGVLGVAQGSVERPRFIVMEYWGQRKTLRPAQGKPIVLVGKGVTFDTGGLNLKPRDGIYEMHMDMSGGAAVIHALAALARMKVKKNVIGLVPAVENMPSGSSYRPGDVLRSMSGKTIEVLDTDAEGRIILADALTYAKRYEPRLVVDVATLTGAAMVALGQRASALFATDKRLEECFRAAGERTGDFVWPLPLWEEYEEEIQGTFADLANVGKASGRIGGAVTAAVFLWQFIKATNGTKATGDPPAGRAGQRQGTRSERDTPWVHLDIAPRMTTVEGGFLAKGSAGAGVGVLVEAIRRT